MWYQKLEDKYTFVPEEWNSNSLIDYMVHGQHLTGTIQKIEIRQEAEVRANHGLVASRLREIDWKEETKDCSSLAIHKLNMKENKDECEEKTEMTKNSED
ncbi:hypothetical protein Trydic_g19292 [Trypoxylus dichotomus]